MSRTLYLIYGTLCYVMTLLVLLYGVGFIGGMIVPKMIDSGSSGPLATSLLINVVLLGLFAVQHSVMARKWFKRWWTRIIPEQIERSTYVLITNLILILLFWQWRPIPEMVWSTTSDLVATILIVLFWFGWGIALVSTFFIDHFRLFGLRQVILNYQGKELPAAELVRRGFYRVVRHPILLGFIIAVWATPDMSIGHLLFAVATTGYILAAIPLEEKDLVEIHGEQYEAYRQSVSMLFPTKYVDSDMGDA